MFRKISLFALIKVYSAPQTLPDTHQTPTTDHSNPPGDPQALRERQNEDNLYKGSLRLLVRTADPVRLDPTPWAHREPGGPDSFPSLFLGDRTIPVLSPSDQSTRFRGTRPVHPPRDPLRGVGRGWGSEAPRGREVRDTSLHPPPAESLKTKGAGTVSVPGAA